MFSAYPFLLCVLCVNVKGWCTWLVTLYLEAVWSNSGTFPTVFQWLSMSWKLKRFAANDLRCYTNINECTMCDASDFSPACEKLSWAGILTFNPCRRDRWVTCNGTGFLINIRFSSSKKNPNWNPIYKKKKEMWAKRRGTLPYYSLHPEQIDCIFFRRLLHYGYCRDETSLQHQLSLGYLKSRKISWPVGLVPVGK